MTIMKLTIMEVIKFSFILFLLHFCNRALGLTADIPSMRSNIQTYFSQPRHHVTETAKQYKLQARTFIENEFKRFGLETEVQMFEDPTNYPSVQFHNVIGVLKGERFGNIQDKILGVGAHYDTFPDHNTPGVDDNGAGVAAMLEVVRQVTEANKAGTKRQNTIIFVSFDAEELRYLGGYALTDHWLQPYLERNYGPGANDKMAEHGVIIMDTMMNFATTKKSQTIPPEYAQETYFPKASANMALDDHEGDFLLLTYRQPTEDLALATSFIAAWNSAGKPEYELEAFPLPLAKASEIEQVPALSAFRRSDHVAFWHDNIPAIFISDTANYRGDMVNCYHQACDNIETMLQDDNLQFLGKTADAIRSTLNTLSETGSGGGSSGSGGSNGGGSGGDGSVNGAQCVACPSLMFIAPLALIMSVLLK